MTVSMHEARVGLDELQEINVRSSYDELADYKEQYESAGIRFCSLLWHDYVNKTIIQLKAYFILGFFMDKNEGFLKQPNKSLPLTCKIIQLYNI